MTAEPAKATGRRSARVSVSEAIDARIDELLAQLPPLTDEQRREAVAIFAAARPRRPRTAGGEAA